MASKLTQFINQRDNLGHSNNMPQSVRQIGREVAQALQPVMNNVQIADTLSVHERTVRRWLRT